MLKLVVLLSGIACAVSAQEPAKVEITKQVQQDLSSFGSQDWQERKEAFYDLTTIGCPVCSHSSFPVLDGIDNAIAMGGVSREIMTQKLIGLLSSEAALSQKLEEAWTTSKQSAPPDYSDYVGDVVMSVTHMRDKRALVPMLSFIDSGNMATESLASYGDGALKAVAPLLKSPDTDPIRRSSAMNVIRRMAEQKNLLKFSDPARARFELKTILIQGIRDSEPFARIEAVRGLTTLGDKDIIPLLESVATDDTYSDSHGSVTGYRYLVREAAQQGVQTLRNRQ